MGDSELPTCVRGVYLIDPERKLQLRLTYPISVGRNFFEIIRVLDSLQITSYHQVQKGLLSMYPNVWMAILVLLHRPHGRACLSSAVRVVSVPIACYTSAIQRTSLAVIVAPSCCGHVVVYRIHCYVGVYRIHCHSERYRVARAITRITRIARISHIPHFTRITVIAVSYSALSFASPLQQRALHPWFPPFFLLHSKVATPANWKVGEDVVILPSVTDDTAADLFPKGFTSIKPYLRITPQPDQ